MPFLMIRNDITKVAADAIVNPANRNLLQGSGTSRAIYQAAGEQELTASCEAIGRCDLGRAVCTPAFGLPAKYIFHAVCPAWHGGFFGEAKQLAGAYHSALELAAEYHCESVAFPLLSSGNYGYPKEQAFRIAVDTITQYVMEHDLTVYLVLYDRDSLAVSRKLFASVEEYIDDHYVAQNDESYGFGRRRRELSERRRLLEEDAAVPMLGAALCRQGEVKYIEVFYHAFLASRFRDNDDITLNKKAQSYLCNRFSIPFSNCFQYFIREKIIASFRKWSP